MFDHVPLWLCEDITACCYMYCYFRNTSDAEECYIYGVYIQCITKYGIFFMIQAALITMYMLNLDVHVYSMDFIYSFHVLKKRNI